ncbi:MULTISPECIES: DUF29 domain-containing protein [Cyanophyceae]|uniref:DUF29 domain-containing protein n=1 Tax=Leptolyngbya subtilissima DQ-A4 TaxID=2933933 RepID=A0ABV0K3F5_9CYAN|nr:DUF29 domain-containing protein [Nodosilinea sp. FACHB-141]MBD2113184.1 DUF29 domain-containing protein [Nodosilinea sp. FACHB-141]
MSPQTAALAALANLYEQDYALWLDTTGQLLKAGRLAEVDIANLLKELNDMGRSEKQALTSNLIVVLMHLLKYAYQPGQRSNNWRFTLKEHRRRLQEALGTSPSLTDYFEQIFADCYQEARDLTATETGVGLENFPIESPFTHEQVLDRAFLPR